MKGSSDLHWTEYYDSLSLLELHALERESPRDVNLLVRIGMRYFKSHELKKCYGYYSRALEIEPDNGWTHLFFGNLCYAVSTYDEAESHFSRAIELLPDVACPQWCLGDALKAQGYISRTEYHYRRAVEIDPDDATAQKKLQKWLADNGSNTA